jgi:myo-inositol-1(or 4)-monophosphatase
MRTLLPEFQAFADALANDAATISISYFRRHLDVETKPDNSPVTVADREIEARMRRTICETYPHHGIFGEEHGQHQSDAEYVWTIDPIDGTGSFATGSPLWGRCHKVAMGVSTFFIQRPGVL